MFTKDLSANVPLYGQKQCFWRGAATGQMIRNGYPNAADRLFYVQQDVWNTIQAHNSTSPADAGWATDPYGLNGCLPVLVATAAADVENVNRAAKLGCQHYLLKPINTAQWFQKVHEVLIEKKPVLRDRQEVLADLAIEPQALYLYLVKLLSNQVKSLLGRLSRALDPDSVAVLLSDACDLSEIATLVGAERLVFALGELASQKALGRRDDSSVPALRD